MIKPLLKNSSRLLFFLVFFNLISISQYAQQKIFAVARDEGFFEIDLSNCSFKSFNILPNINYSDVALCPSGAFYAIEASNTKLYRIDTTTKTSTFIGNLSGTYNNLVCGKDNFLYGIESGMLKKINPTTLAETSIGSPLNFGPQGDLTFYNDSIFFTTTLSSLGYIDSSSSSFSSGLIGSYNQPTVVSLGLANYYEQSANDACQITPILLASGSKTGIGVNPNSGVYRANTNIGAFSVICPDIIDKFIEGLTSEAEWLTTEEYKTAGRDTSIAICQTDTLLSLFKLLPDVRLKNGTWEHNQLSIVNDSLLFQESSPFGTYIVKYVLCGDTSTIAINVNSNTPVFDASIIVAPDTFFCANDSVFIGTEAIFSSYKWNDNHTSPKVMISDSPGTYTLYAKNNEGCIAYDSLVVTEIIDSISLGNDTSLCLGGSIILGVENRFSSYLWNVDADTNIILVNKEGEYFLTVTNSFNCPYSDAVNIEFEQCGPFIPNSFTPNGDGLNDLFLIPYLDVDLDNFAFSILDRWGNNLFVTQNHLGGWNGIIGDTGILAQQDVYVWKVVSEKINRIGIVSLIR